VETAEYMMAKTIIMK